MMNSFHRPTIAILASGSGSTAEAFIRASAEGHIETQVGLIICNNEHAGIFERVKKLNNEYNLSIETEHISKHTYPANGELLEMGQQTKAEEEAILRVLHAGNFDAIALMGYMKRVGPRLVHEFGWRAEYEHPYQARMVNTHPGLLPETKGLYGVFVQEYVVKNQLPYGGQTLHIVAEDYDEGPTIAEHKVTVEPGDSPESLFARVQTAEKQYVPTDIDAFIKLRQQKLERVQ